MLAIFVVLFSSDCISIDAAEEERVSEIYDSQEVVPAPEQEIVNEAGEYLILLRTEIEMIPLTDRRNNVDSHIIYKAVRKEVPTPESALISISDEETGQTFDKILPLKDKRYYNERWENFEFKVTFHTYGADLYRLGTLEIPAGDPMPDMKAAEQEVLSSIGLTLRDCRIESYRWSGETYSDQTGELCRDALASAVQRVWDCDAVYGGVIDLPDLARYRRKSVYGTVLEETEGFEIADVNSKTAGETSAANQQDNLPMQLWKFIKNHVTVTIGITLLAVSIILFCVLLRLAKALQKKRDDKKHVF